MKNHFFILPAIGIVILCLSCAAAPFQDPDFHTSGKEVDLLVAYPEVLQSNVALNKEGEIWLLQQANIKPAFQQATNRFVDKLRGIGHLVNLQVIGPEMEISDGISHYSDKTGADYLVLLDYSSSYDLEKEEETESFGQNDLSISQNPDERSESIRETSTIPDRRSLFPEIIFQANTSVKIVNLQKKETIYREWFGASYRETLPDNFSISVGALFDMRDEDFYPSGTDQFNAVLTITAVKKDIILAVGRMTDSLIEGFFGKESSTKKPEKDLPVNNNAPLFLSLRNKDIQNSLELIRAGESCLIQDSDGLTPLHYATRLGNIELAQALMEKPLVQFPDENGVRPLHIAAANNHLVIAKSLIDIGADVNSWDKNSRTPLHMAALCDCKQMVELLLLEGASPSVKDKYQMLPADLAEKRRNEEIVRLLEGIDRPEYPVMGPHEAEH